MNTVKRKPVVGGVQPVKIQPVLLSVSQKLAVLGFVHTATLVIALSNYQEKRNLSVMRLVILQTLMRRDPVGTDVEFSRAILCKLY